MSYSYVRCDRCYGSGELDCPQCNSGFFSVAGKNFVLVGGDDGCWDTCDHCDGTGHVDCPDCGGSGEVREDDDD